MSTNRLYFPLIGLTASLLALSYGFPWLRIPDILGTPIPLQRALGWISLLLLIGLAAIRRSLPASANVRIFLSMAFVFFAHTLLTGGYQALTAEIFAPRQLLTETAKLAAVFSTAYLVYYALVRARITERRFVQLLIFSGGLCIGATFVLLALYWSGFRTTNEFFAPSFGGALGVWPTGTSLPRLAGPSAEPQQLSVLFVTPLLLMLAPRTVRTWWPIAAIGVLALVMSQSKFSLVSLTLILSFCLLAFRRQRLTLLAASLVLMPIAAAYVATLPITVATLNQGFSAQAFTERFENAALLVQAFLEHPVTGIGLGQYGTYRGSALFDDPFMAPGYFANNDYLTLLAETGLIGFFLMGTMFITLFVRFALLIPQLNDGSRIDYLAVLTGTVAIALNMLIGYEFMHVFFWINLGLLLYMHERYAGRAPSK